MWHGDCIWPNAPMSRRYALLDASRNSPDGTPRAVRKRTKQQARAPRAAIVRLDGIARSGAGRSLRGGGPACERPRSRDEHTAGLNLGPCRGVARTGPVLGALG